MGLAIGVEEGQAVKTLVVLRETAEAEEESAPAHFHQHSPLVSVFCRQGFGHLYHLRGGLWLPLAFSDWGLRSGVLRGGLLRRGGWDGQRVRTGIHRDFGG